MAHKIKLEIFEGPLDLLLYLIKKDDIDIRNIPIASVTEQYMAYIEMMKILDLDIVGDFLVMAATLIQIKSRMLLPPDPTQEGAPAEDPRQELADRLLEYQRFQEIAEELREKEKRRRDLFPRNVDEATINQLREESKEVYFETSLFDLINALYDALKKTPQEVIHEIVKEEYTVEQKIHEILHALLEQSSLKLEDLFARARSRIEIIVTFLGILELIRLREIKVMQKTMFGEIEVFRNKDNIVPLAVPAAEDDNGEAAEPEPQA